MERPPQAMVKHRGFSINRLFGGASHPGRMQVHICSHIWCWHRICKESDAPRIEVVMISSAEKPPDSEAGRGGARSGAPEHGRGCELQQGRPAELPHPQRLRRGQGGHLHPGGRCQVLAGER